MEGRATDDKSAPDRREKGEIKHEATASASEVPPFDDSEPPPLEEVSEPHSKVSTPPLTSPLSEDLEKGFSPPSPYAQKSNNGPLSPSRRVLSPSFYAQRAQSPSSYIQEVGSPSSYVEEVLSPSSYTDDQQSEGRQSNVNPPQNEPPPVVQTNDSNHAQTKADIVSNASTVSKEKLDIKPSSWTSIPSLVHSVASAAKHASFKSTSLSSRSSAAIYGSKPWWKGKARQMKIVEAALRIGGAILALITFSVMCATSEWRQGAGSTFKMSFTNYQSYNYLVAVNVISFVYSCWQTFATWQSRESGIFTATRERMLYTYVCDQVLAFLLFSASTAAATAAQLSRHGLQNIWPPACATWSLWRFCSKADAAVVMSFFSSFFVIAAAVFSGYHVSHSLSQ